MALIREIVSKKKKRYLEKGFNLDLSYITERVIAMGFPSDKIEGIYRNPMEEVIRFLETFHSGRYRVYNLCSERSYHPSKFHYRVACFPFDDHNPPPAALLISVCEDAKNWLDAHPENVVAVHCKAGKGRTGTVICAYFLYTGFQKTAAESLTFFAFQRTEDSQGVTIPSQKRYVGYMEQIVAKKKYQQRTDILQIIRIAGIQPSKLAISIKLTVREKAVHFINHATASMKSDSDSIVFVIDLKLCGDVKLEFFDKEEQQFHCWFNTAFINDNRLKLDRTELDKINRGFLSKTKGGGSAAGGEFYVEFIFAGEEKASKSEIAETVIVKCSPSTSTPSSTSSSTPSTATLSSPPPSSSSQSLITSPPSPSVSRGSGSSLSASSLQTTFASSPGSTLSSTSPSLPKGPWGKAAPRISIPTDQLGSYSSSSSPTPSPTVSPRSSAGGDSRDSRMLMAGLSKRDKHMTTDFLESLRFTLRRALDEIVERLALVRSEVELTPAADLLDLAKIIRDIKLAVEKYSPVMTKQAENNNATAQPPLDMQKLKRYSIASKHMKMQNLLMKTIADVIDNLNALKNHLTEVKILDEMYSTAKLVRLIRYQILHTSQIGTYLEDDSEESQAHLLPAPGRSDRKKPGKSSKYENDDEGEEEEIDPSLTDSLISKTTSMVGNIKSDLDVLLDVINKERNSNHTADHLQSTLEKVRLVLEIRKQLAIALDH